MGSRGNKPKNSAQTPEAPKSLVQAATEVVTDVVKAAFSPEQKKDDEPASEQKQKTPRASKSGMGDHKKFDKFN